MSESYTFPVDLTTIMVFASALGETNRIYYDEAHAKQTPLGGVIAPPTFPAASSLWDPTYYLRGVRRIPAPATNDQNPAPANSAGSGDRKSDQGALLHGEIHYEYHAPIRPGMRLTVTTRLGKRWEKQGKRGGTMRFWELISGYRDETGTLVVSATSVVIATSEAIKA